VVAGHGQGGGASIAAIGTVVDPFDEIFAPPAVRDALAALDREIAGYGSFNGATLEESAALLDIPTPAGPALATLTKGLKENGKRVHKMLKCGIVNGQRVCNDGDDVIKAKKKGKKKDKPSAEAIRAFYGDDNDEPTGSEQLADWVSGGKKKSKALNRRRKALLAKVARVGDPGERDQVLRELEAISVPRSQGSPLFIAKSAKKRISQSRRAELEEDLMHPDPYKRDAALLALLEV
jgi:hypothetical protein